MTSLGRFLLSFILIFVCFEQASQAESVRLQAESGIFDASGWSFQNVALALRSQRMCHWQHLCPVEGIKAGGVI